MENIGRGGADEIIGMSLLVMDPRHSSMELSSKTGLAPKHSALTLLRFSFQCHVSLIKLGAPDGKNSSCFRNNFENKRDANDSVFQN